MNRRWMLLAAALGLAAAVQAQAQTAMVPAEVVKIDRNAGRITLKQAEIKSLEMPAMNMAWRVASPRLLEDLEVGDRVRFVPERIDGQYTITQLVKAPR